jgi:cytochrome c-type biogenesis protein
VEDLIGSGQLYLSLPIALLAGLVSFLSPCVLPLVPGYLGYVGGSTGTEPASRRRLLLGVSLFVLGFAVVFTLTVTASGVVGVWLVRYTDIITRVAGVFVILLGLVFIGQFAVLQRSVKLRWAPATGVAGAFFLGLVFGIGWAPCIGPTLAVIIGMAASSGSFAQSVLLGVVYSLGLGLPFLLVALGFSWVAKSISWVKRHIRVVNIIGGALLVVIGILMVSGVWILWMTELQGVIGGFEPAL